MKRAVPLIASIAVVCLGTGISACGGESHSVPATAQTSSDTPATGNTPSTGNSSAPQPKSYWKHDGDVDDNEPANRHPEADDRVELDSFGRRAHQADRDAISSLVKRYYAAASAGDSATVCMLLSPAFATQLGAGSSNSVQPNDTACGAAIAPLLAQQHEQLTNQEIPTMIVTDVRINGDSALAVLGFQRAPQSTILVERQGSTWRVGELFGNELA